MSQQRETHLDVAGMSCASCVRHVEHAVGQLDGVERVHVDLASGQVTVCHDRVAVPIASLVAAIVDAGHVATARTELAAAD